MRHDLLLRRLPAQINQLLLDGGDVGIDRIFQQQPLFTAHLLALLAEAVAAQHRNLVCELAVQRVFEVDVLGLPGHHLAGLLQHPVLLL